MIGVVAIGRNEGERLRRCLESVVGRCAAVVYVDSGSTDGSVAMARQMGVEVVELDTTVAFTAARARNEGVARLLEVCPQVAYVQVVDGDCEVMEGWLELAQRELDDDKTLAVVCGRRRERQPNASIYNRLCDIEWDTPIGEAEACGGDAMIRLSAFQQVGGYNPQIIAGEEPELCLRLRREDCCIRRIDAEMTLHDAAIVRFSQWWRRSVRAGHACAEGYWRHGEGPEHHERRRLASIIAWAAGLPLLVVVVGAALTGAWSLLFLAGYPVLAWRVFRGQRQLGRSVRDAQLYACFTVLGKFAELAGAGKFAFARLTGRRSRIIEYKGARTSTGGEPIAAASGMMRLAYLTTGYPEVSHTFVRREILELERRGHHVLRLSIHRPDSDLVDPADIDEAKQTFYVLDHRVRLLSATIAALFGQPQAFAHALAIMLGMHRRSDRSLLRHIAYMAEACALLPLVRDTAIQHVHVHFGTNAAAVARLLRRLGGPSYSMTIHGPDELDAPRAFSLGEKIADSAFTVAITDYCSAQLRRWAGCTHWHKIHIVHCTVGAEFDDAPPPITDDCHTLLCIGRLAPQKGQLLLIEAMGKLAADSIEAKLVLAGDGELRPVIEDRIAELGLRDRVAITGWITGKQVAEHLVNCRALVLPSFAEGLPVVIMEAMAKARPVISTYIAGIPELVHPSRNGYLVHAGNVDQLVDAMRRVLNAPADRLNAMGQDGQKCVRRDHHTATEVDKLESLLRRACAEGAA